MDFDINTLKQIFVNASHHTIGDEQMLRSAFEVYFPDIRKLRNAGFSFEQITELLEQCELSLPCSMVEQYFEDQLMEKSNKNVQRINEMSEILRQFNEANPDKVEDGKVVTVAPASEPHATVAIPLTEGLHCLALLSAKPRERRDGVPEEVYMDGQMEHPAIPGLMLSKDERLYGKQLEIVDQNGGINFETVQEMAFRVKWMKLIPRTETASSKNFVKMDYSLFENISNHKRPQ